MNIVLLVFKPYINGIKLYNVIWQFGGVQHYIFEFFKNIVTSFTHSPADGFQVVPSGWQNTHEYTSPVHLSGLLSPAGGS